MRDAAVALHVHHGRARKDLLHVPAVAAAIIGEQQPGCREDLHIGNMGSARRAGVWQAWVAEDTMAEDDLDSVLFGKVSG